MGDLMDFGSMPPPPPPQPDPQLQHTQSSQAPKLYNRRFTAKEWEEQKPKIRGLYVEEDMPLPYVQITLSQSGFQATYISTIPR